jgi:hypothetical protein
LVFVKVMRGLTVSVTRPLSAIGPSPGSKTTGY